MDNAPEVSITISIPVPEVALSSSSVSGCCRTMPVIGMGTAVGKKNYDASAMKLAILEAIKLGYRHFDTAPSYASEQPLGEAIAEALVQGLVSSRDDVFITSKLWCPDAHHHLVIPALENSLR